MRVAIQPMGFVNKDILEFLTEALMDIFKEVTVLNSVDIPKECYNPERRQYNSSCILSRLESQDIILAVVDQDLYASNLNFVFGEAELKGKRAIISLYRLKPKDEQQSELFKLRTLKEAMHELGHVFGLKHCNSKYCVMYFSNSIFDTDRKDWRYCEVCKALLMSMG